jgi:hypothetical protein
MQFYSQVGQDRFLFENFFYGHRGGTFVDVGAYDGEKFSNVNRKAQSNLQASLR